VSLRADSLAGKPAPKDIQAFPQDFQSLWRRTCAARELLHHL